MDGGSESRVTQIMKCFVDRFQLLLRSDAQAGVMLKPIRMPNVDKQFVGAADLGLSSADRHI